MNESAPQPKRDRWLMTIPVLLLACVWAFQLMLTQVYMLTPWKGGGFGMFSVTLVRDLKIEAYDRQGRAVSVDPLSFSKRHQRLNLRTLWMPNDGIMCHVAERILKSPLVEVSFEKSVQFDAQQGAWWRVQEGADHDAKSALKKRHERLLVLGHPLAQQPDSKALFVADRVVVSVMRTEVDTAGSQLKRRLLRSPVTWQDGRCEVAR